MSFNAKWMLILKFIWKCRIKQIKYKHFQLSCEVILPYFKTNRREREVHGKGEERELKLSEK